MIRPLECEDEALLLAKAQTYGATMYPELIPDVDKLHWLVRNATMQMEHWSRVIGPVGEPQAALITRLENNLWAMKKHAVIMLWYSEIPGGGALLLREFKRWVTAQKSIVLAGFDADWVQTDTRPLALAERIGFKRRGAGGYFYFPKGPRA